MHTCPRCGSERVRRSHRAGGERSVSRRPGQRAYRCRKCGARFWQVSATAWVSIGLAVAAVVVAAVAWQLWDPFAELAERAEDWDKIEQARKRDGVAEYAEALRYLNGEGVPRDLTHGVGLLERAAQDGHVPARRRLGLSLRDGIGVASDDERAVTWLRLAADAGYGPAQFELGRMYVSGRGWARDVVAAYAWLTVAAAQKVEGAAEARAALVATLKPDELEAARAEARRLGESRLPPGASIDH